MNKEILTALQQGVVTVTFMKENGDVRVMDCTKDLQRVPPSKWPTGKKDFSESEETTCRAYDVNAQGWRSFRFARVLRWMVNKNIPSISV